eukprot:scaffold2875_cov247-Pinguiococcus_pyrenoidosus.AAC.16
MADIQLGHFETKHFEKLLLAALLHENAIRADAGLTGVPELVGHQRLDGSFHVASIEGEKGCVATQLKAHALHAVRAASVEEFAHLRHGKTHADMSHDPSH